MFKFTKYGRFFYVGDTGGNTSGAGGGNADPNNQQQQQQQEPFVSPFAGIDKALLDDGARQAVEKAEADLQRLQKTEATSRQFQSRYDALQYQHQQAVQQLESLRGTQQQQQQKAQPTYEQELLQQYLDAGMDRESAAKVAKVNAPILQLREERAVETAVTKVLQQVAPFAGNVATTAAEKAFSEAMSSDTQGIYSDEIKQDTWSHIQNALKAGQQVTTELAHNFAAIALMKSVREGKAKLPTAMPVQTTSSRFSYPGASASVATVAKTGNSADIVTDPDLAAALAATTGGWPSKEKRAAGNNIHITRGGNR